MIPLQCNVLQCLIWTPCREWMMLFFSCGPGRWKLCKSSKKNDKTDISCWENTNLGYSRKLSKLISRLNSIEISPAGCKKPVKCQEVSRKQRSVGWHWRGGQLWSDHLSYFQISLSLNWWRQAGWLWLGLGLWGVSLYTATSETFSV